MNHIFIMAASTTGTTNALKGFLADLSKIGLPLLWIITALGYGALAAKRLEIKVLHQIILMLIGAAGVVVFLSTNASLASATTRDNTQIHYLLWILLLGGGAMVLKDSRS